MRKRKRRRRNDRGNVCDTIMLWIWVSKETLFIRISRFFIHHISFLLLLSLFRSVFFYAVTRAFNYASFYACERLHLPYEIYVTGNIKNHNSHSLTHSLQLVR